ncbi:putative vesicle-trafficking protein SEC22a [Apostichopus japonicus]|uniref:Putative vesicle-trafficking protein SEC22a n=1 Tax=Stichopus japonicus TaxID=307972 RepID=A0A2G8LMC5_STIJA|nr:putative vesicle-trafficking protein SEC22a [Apostichopus japonicus]
MVVFALISRVSDGLPLSATTDHETSQRVLESKKCAKLLSKKAASVPDRCSLHTGSHWLFLISSLGVSFISLCEENYPSVLAFCFLDELQREFISSYDARKVKNVNRPYALIEFNIILQKVKQRYNNTRSLKPRTNLNDMSQEVKLRPPHRLSLDDIGLEQMYETNGSMVAEHFNPLPGKKQPPIGCLGMLFVVLCLLWGFYHFIRIGTIVSSGPIFAQDQYQEILVALSAFFGACVSSILQAYFILFPSLSLRILKATLSGVLITFCCSVLFMDGWLDEAFAYGHIASCWLSFLLISCRQSVAEKLPNYTV